MANIYKWIMVSLHISEANKNTSRATIFVRWLINLFVTTLLGFVFLSLMLWALSTLSPSKYRELTKWANQPALPIVKSCQFNPIESTDLNASATMKDLKRFNVSFEIDTSAASNSSVILFTENLAIGIYPLGSKAVPSDKDKSFMVFSKKDLRRQPLSVEAIVDEEAFEVGENRKFEGTSCPIGIAFFGETI